MQYFPHKMRLSIVFGGSDVAKVSMKCLILDDNALIRLDYSSALEDAGFACHTCATVAEAGYLLRTHVYDAMLMDLQVEDGLCLPLVDLVHALGRQTIMVLITGTGAFPNGEVAALSPRIDYVLRKPIIMDDLLAIVEYATQRKDITH